MTGSPNLEEYMAVALLQHAEAIDSKAEMQSRSQEVANAAGRGAGVPASPEQQAAAGEDKRRAQAETRQRLARSLKGLAAEVGAKLRAEAFTRHGALMALWTVALVYALALSPHQLSARQDWGIFRTLGWHNAVTFCLLTARLLFPLALFGLLVPSVTTMKPIEHVPAWPFIAASYFAGSFSLIPFFAIWNTPPHTSRAQMKVPPARSQLIGRRNTMLRLTEGQALPAALLAASAALVLLPAACNRATWCNFWDLYKSSRLVHMALLDVGLMAALAAVLMFHDAKRRDWAPRRFVLPALAALPLAGTAAYLLARPKAYDVHGGSRRRRSVSPPSERVATRSQDRPAQM